MNKFLRPLAALLCFHSVTHAENWPAWRGPTGLGITTEKNLPLQWSATNNVRWKTPLPDPGNSTPIIWGKKLFVTQAIKADGRRLVLCFDRDTGKKLWESGTTWNEPEKTHETNPGCSSSPVTDGERLIAWFGSAGLFCFDLNGKELWHRDLGQQSHTWGNAASPVIYKDLCFLNFGPGKRSFFIAVNKKTGKTRWQVDIPEMRPTERADNFGGKANGEVGSWSTPLIIKTRKRDELVISLPEHLRAFDPKSGKELWHCEGLNPLVYTSPIYGEGIIVAMGGFLGTSIAVKPGGGDVTPGRLWLTGRDRNRIGSGIIHDGHIYIGDMPGIADCIDLATGKMVWQERLPAKGPKGDCWSSMILAGDRLYVLNQSGDCIVLRASPKFEVLSVNSIGNEMTNSSLAVSDGHLFFRTHRHLWCVGL